MGKETAQKINKPRAIRRLVIWYKRNSAVTSIVDTAASSAATASNVAGNMVSGAGSVVTTASNVAGNVAGNVVSSAESVVNTASSVVSNASSIAKNTLQPLVFDPLKRLQNNDNLLDKEEDSQSNRIWIAVDGMGGDYAPGPILEGCLEAIGRFPINIKFVGEIENNTTKKQGIFNQERINFLDGIEFQNVDVWFPLLHGFNGEDGSIHGLLRFTKKPLVGCGIIGSSIGMDKILMKTIFSNLKLPQVNYLVFQNEDLNDKEVKNKIINKILKKFKVFIFKIFGYIFIN